jgi:hypothetical protein
MPNGGATLSHLERERKRNLFPGAPRTSACLSLDAAGEERRRQGACTPTQRVKPQKSVLRSLAKTPPVGPPAGRRAR